MEEPRNLPVHTADTTREAQGLDLAIFFRIALYPNSHFKFGGVLNYNLITH